MKIKAFFAPIALFWASLVSFPLCAALPPEVSALLKKAQVSEANVAVFVQAVTNDKPLLEMNGDKPMNPASVMKLVTTYAALEILGAEHTWQTRALSEGTPQNGRLTSTLYLKGAGDPYMTQEAFAHLLRSLYLRGVREIAGDLVLDRSSFALVPFDPAAFDNDPTRPYNAGADALLVDFQSLALVIGAPTDARTVTVFVDSPAASMMRIDNRLTRAEGACGAWRERVRIKETKESLILEGSFPAACEEKTLYLATDNSNAHIERLFRALWQEMGGQFLGRVTEGKTPKNAKTLAVHNSLPLADLIRPLNKYSNNVMAKNLFLSLATSETKTEGEAQKRVSDLLRDKRIPACNWVFENGSGLSRTERLTAQGLGKLLLLAWQSPFMPELMASLPVSGVDGTLKTRFQDRAAQGLAHLKTGYLGNVRSLAGYVLSNSGQRFLLVALINDPKAQNAKMALDALVDWVAKQ